MAGPYFVILNPLASVPTGVRNALVAGLDAVFPAAERYAVPIHPLEFTKALATIRANPKAGDIGHYLHHIDYWLDAAKTAPNLTFPARSTESRQDAATNWGAAVAALLMRKLGAGWDEIHQISHPLKKPNTKRADFRAKVGPEEIIVEAKGTLDPGAINTKILEAKDQLAPYQGPTTKKFCVVSFVPNDKSHLLPLTVVSDPPATHNEWLAFSKRFEMEQLAVRGLAYGGLIQASERVAKAILKLWDDRDAANWESRTMESPETGTFGPPDAPSRQIGNRKYFGRQILSGSRTYFLGVDPKVVRSWVDGGKALDKPAQAFFNEEPGVAAAVFRDGTALEVKSSNNEDWAALKVLGNKLALPGGTRATTSNQ
jgi:hypothetical protein